MGSAVGLYLFEGKQGGQCTEGNGPGSEATGWGSREARCQPPSDPPVSSTFISTSLPLFKTLILVNLTDLSFLAMANVRDLPTRDMQPTGPGGDRPKPKSCHN